MSNSIYHNTLIQLVSDNIQIKKINNTCHQYKIISPQNELRA